MADVSMGDVGDASDNEGLPLEGAVDDSALEDYSGFQGLSDELGQESGYSEDAEPEEPEYVDRGIDSLSLEGESEEPDEPTPRAQKRIQTLSSRTKELEEQLGQTQQYYQQQLAQMQYQMQQQASQRGNQDALSQQLQLQQQQLQALQQQRQKEEYDSLTPMEQLKRDILREAGAQSSQAVSQQVTALQQELNKEKQAREKARQEADRNARYAYYTQQTEQARSQTLLNGFAEEDASRLAAEADEMILAYAGAFGIEPREAAGKLKAYMDNYHLARLKTRSNGEGKRVRKSRAVPRPAPAGRRQAREGMGMPTLSQLRKAGFDSHVDWIAANEPPVS
tara:strand:- start:913 stop:1923 length:1011 start_codon:yes stop_codon:yes gene_type:complete